MSGISTKSTGDGGVSASTSSSNIPLVAESSKAEIVAALEKINPALTAEVVKYFDGVIDELKTNHEWAKYYGSADSARQQNLCDGPILVPIHSQHQIFEKDLPEFSNSFATALQKTNAATASAQAENEARFAVTLLGKRMAKDAGLETLGADADAYRCGSDVQAFSTSLAMRNERAAALRTASVAVQEAAYNERMILPPLSSSEFEAKLRSREDQESSGRFLAQVDPGLAVKITKAFSADVAQLADSHVRIRAEIVAHDSLTKSGVPSVQNTEVCASPDLKQKATRVFDTLRSHVEELTPQLSEALQGRLRVGGAEATTMAKSALWRHALVAAQQYEIGEIAKDPRLSECGSKLQLLHDTAKSANQEYLDAISQMPVTQALVELKKQHLDLAGQCDTARAAYHEAVEAKLYNDDIARGDYPRTLSPELGPVGGKGQGRMENAWAQYRHDRQEDLTRKPEQAQAQARRSELVSNRDKARGEMLQLCDEFIGTSKERELYHKIDKRPYEDTPRPVQAKKRIVPTAW